MLEKQTTERKLNAISMNDPSLYNPENHNGRNNGKYSNWSREELIDEITKLKKRKKYGIVWEEKEETVVEECKNKLPILKENGERSINSNEEEITNILIEGDNYQSLSVLNYTHKEKVDVIYIDPPYNTGNESFVYNDNIVDSEDPYRHSKWLSFMSRRLYLAKNLLKITGILFVSIDDNEQAQLKLLCDEIFNENNFIGEIVIQSNPRGSQASKYLAKVHEYVLVYAKSSKNLRISGFSKEESMFTEYPFTDENGRRYRLLGLRQRGGEWRREQRPNMFFPIYVNPKDKTVSLVKTNTHTVECVPKRPSGEEGRWTWSQKKVSENLNLLVGRKVNRKGEEDFYDIFRIDYYDDNEGNESLSKPKTIWLDKEINYQNGRNELKEIFDGKDIFDYPKTTYLIKKLISLSPNKNGIVLDFFAGSGTTGNALLLLNKEDGGKRQFILCTDNQGNNGTGLRIATDICYPRIKRVIEGYKNIKGEKVEGIESNLKYYVTDFVDATETDINKKKLVDRSTEILCLKENCFILKFEGEYSKIYTNQQDKALCIIYDDDGIEEAKTRLQELGLKTVVYIFSLDDSNKAEEFSNLKDLVEIKPIPATILNVYRRIFR